MLYYKQLEIRDLLLMNESAVIECTLMTFVDLISTKYKIIIKTPKAEMHCNHTIQNNYSTASKDSHTRHQKQLTSKKQ